MRDRIERIRRYTDQVKVNSHNTLRFWLVLITIISVLLTYLSGALRINEVVLLLGKEASLQLRWWLYIGGCSG
jgi:hypothetical protein